MNLGIIGAKYQDLVYTQYWFSGEPIHRGWSLATSTFLSEEEDLSVSRCQHRDA